MVFEHTTVVLNMEAKCEKIINGFNGELNERSNLATFETLGANFFKIISWGQNLREV